MSEALLWDPNPVGSFDGARLRYARAFRDVTLKQLADQVGVSFGLISHYEKGLKSPSPVVADAIAQVLGFLPKFFYSPLSDVWLEEQCSFRHRRATSEAVKRRARAHGTLISEVVEYLQHLVEFPAYSVPEISVTRTEDIETAAERCRSHFGLGISAPIASIGRVLENAGVLVVQHLAHSDQIDAFSRRGKAVSVVVLNTTRQSVSRWNFDMAHELGHLVMHAGIETGSEETEFQANCFGGAFLLPRRAFSRDFGSRRFSVQHLFELKIRWNASASAILKRARQLDLIDALTYQQSYKTLSRLGALKTEPHEPEFQAPELLAAAFTSLRDETGRSIRVMCEDLALRPETFVEITGIQPDASPSSGLRLVQG